MRTLHLILGISSAAATRDVHGLDLSGRGNAVHVCLWCDDVDAAFQRMLLAGARVARAPLDVQDGCLRNGWVAEPAGNLIEAVHERW